jgi:hypothetical protein
VCWQPGLFEPASIGFKDFRSFAPLWSQTLVAFGPFAMASSTAPVKNPMVKTKTARISLTAHVLVTGKLYEHKTAGQRG